MLNSFWGKFGENSHEPTTEADHNAQHLLSLVFSPFNDIRQDGVSNDDWLEIAYANLKEDQPDNRHRHSCFHHRSRQTQTVILPGTTSTTSALL